MDPSPVRDGERPYASLGRREQIARLRDLARAALVDYGVGDARLTLLRHEHNTTFRVDGGEAASVLRINRPGVHTPATIASEMAWLQALRRDTGLGVPEPVAARDGALAVLAHAPGMPGPRVCVLVRHQPGRFVDERLTAANLRSVARLMAGLQEHGARWARPEGFARPRVDTLTTAAKAAGVASAPAPPWHGEQPSREDADRCLQLVTELFAVADAAVLAAALDVVWATTRALAAQPGTAGLIHGDLHQENYLFERGAARAIDFDDCGWGFFLHDVAVTLSELEGRPRYAELRDALLDEYAGRRSLPANADDHLAALAILRRIQLLAWVIESRGHAAFRDDWRPRAREQLDALATSVAAR